MGPNRRGPGDVGSSGVRIELSPHAHARLAAGDRTARDLAREASPRRTAGGDRLMLTIPSHAASALLCLDGEWRVLEPDFEKDPSTGVLALAAEVDEARLGAFDLAGHGFRQPFGAVGDPATLETYVHPFYALEPRRTGAEAIFAILRDGDLHNRAAAAWRALEWRLWSGQPHAPEVLARGEGYLFFETDDGVGLGRARYPLRQDGAPILFLRPRPGAAWRMLTPGDAVEDLINEGRGVRALAARAQLDGGAICLHAAAIAVAGRAYVICGDKGLGKTSNLVWALENLPGADFISNDKVFISRGPSGPFVSGSPQSAPVRIGALARSPRLSRLLREGGQPGAARGYRVTLDPDRRPSGGHGRYDPQEVYFAPSELASVFGKHVLPGASLGAVVLLAPKSDRSPTPWSKIPAAEGLDELALHLRTRLDDAAPYWDVLLPSQTGPGSLEIVLAGTQFLRLSAAERLGEAWGRFADDGGLAAESEKV